LDSTSTASTSRSNRIACRPEAFHNAFGRYEINPDARATLKPGKNILAVNLIQTNKGGDEYFDLALVDEILTKESNSR
jgi:hypothetical protein